MKPSECRRAGDDSFHVAYAVRETYDDLNDNVETENLTHADSIDDEVLAERGDTECSWIADTGNGVRLARIGLIRLFLINEPESDFLIDQQITAETAEQLSDMFREAASAARKTLAAYEAKKRDAVEAHAKQNPPLPFGEPTANTR